MTIGVSWLFVPLYRFEYRSQALWCEGRLTQLRAVVEDDGESSIVEAGLRDGALELNRGAETGPLAPGTIPTNHWNVAALEQDALLNTITGRMNRITISPSSTRKHSSVSLCECQSNSPSRRAIFRSWSLTSPTRAGCHGPSSTPQHSCRFHTRASLMALSMIEARIAGMSRRPRQ